MVTSERRARDRARRHQLIVTAARELAEAEGWHAVTTRRLAERIEYSQPVLYSHFTSKDAIVREVAIQGFAELAATLHRARTAATSPEAALRALAVAYLSFAATHPVLYDAMFVRPIDLAFGQDDSPAPLRSAFGELLTALAPLTPEHNLDVLAELAWSTLHGLATLTHAHRLRPDYHQARLDLLIDHLTSQPNRHNDS